MSRKQEKRMRRNFFRSQVTPPPAVKPPLDVFALDAFPCLNSRAPLERERERKLEHAPAHGKSSNFLGIVMSSQMESTADENEKDGDESSPQQMCSRGAPLLPGWVRLSHAKTGGYTIFEFCDGTREYYSQDMVSPEIQSSSAAEGPLFHVLAPLPYSFKPARFDEIAGSSTNDEESSCNDDEEDGNVEHSEW